MVFLTGKYSLFLSRIRSAGSVTFLPVVALFLFFVLADCSTAGAQSRFDQLQRGDRVRISAPIVNSAKVTGEVSRLSDDTVLALSVKDSLFFVSHYLIQGMEISRGQKRPIGRGFLIGAVAGTLVNGILTSAFNDVCRPGDRSCFFKISNGEAFLSGGLKGLIAGGVAGAVAGFFMRIDRWERVPLDVAVDFRNSNPDPKLNQFGGGPQISVRIPISK